MSEMPSNQPMSVTRSIELWLEQLNPDYVHEQGWQEANRTAHALALGVRNYALQTFPEDPQRRQDFIDGFTFGILGQQRLASVEELEQLFMTPSATKPTEIVSTEQQSTTPLSEAA